MARSRLLDQGREWMYVYMEETVTDSRGNRVKVPSDTPVRIRVTTSSQRQGDAELPGQVSMKTMRVTARKAPVGSWARVVFEGEDWDIMAPPRFTPGASKATQHVEFLIRSRNRLRNSSV